MKLQPGTIYRLNGSHKSEDGAYFAFLANVEPRTLCGPALAGGKFKPTGVDHFDVTGGELANSWRACPRSKLPTEWAAWMNANNPVTV
jgi:hypothetical protein